MTKSETIQSAIRERLKNVYRPAEYPALAAQLAEWRETRPLAGMRILDATPLYTNTLVKFLPLLAAGAELTVGTGDKIPYDPAVADWVAAVGLARLHNGGDDPGQWEFDAILDCGGVHNTLPARFGYAELTRSGLYAYGGAAEHSPVILVDDSRIKAIETCLGTGEGFLRAMRQLGYGDFDGKSIVIFGCGKVGRGVAFYSARAGAAVTAVDDPARVAPPPGVRLIDYRDGEAVAEAVRRAWCVVSVTGVTGALTDSPAVEILRNGSQLVAAMGVTDEWGPGLPSERVLNRKQALNFILEEPTRLRYIDPTMALSNAAVTALAAGNLRPGIQKIDPAIESRLWHSVERDGLIAGELKEAGL